MNLPRLPRSLLLLALGLSVSFAWGAALPAPVPAPAWKAKDLDGKVVTSDEFKGKVVVLDFWATWCAPCKAEIPGYVALQKKYRDQGLVVIGASRDDDGPRRIEAIRKFAAAVGINYLVVMSNDDLEAGLGGLEAIPTTFIIDRDGKIRAKKVGAEPAAQFEKELLAVLKPAA